MLFIARSLTVVVSGGFRAAARRFADLCSPPSSARQRSHVVPVVCRHRRAPRCLSRTNFGRWIVAGGFPGGRINGHPHRARKIACFILCSMLSDAA
jgi:hypothetical protein